MSRLLPWLLAAPALHAAGAPATPAAEGAQASSEERKASEIYLLARLGRATEAEREAREFLLVSPGHRAVRLTLCSMYAGQRRIEDLRRAAREYLRLYPDDAQGLYFLSSAEYMSGHYTEALRILRRIREVSAKGGHYPYLVDLAASSWQAGDWPEALEAQLELLRNERISPQLRMQLRRQLDELYRKHLDLARVGVEYLWLKTGDAVRPFASETVQVSRRLRVEAGYRADEIGLLSSPGILHAHNYRQEGHLRAQYAHDTLWTSEYALGASEAGPLGGLRLEYELPSRRSWWAEAGYGARATDSLLLEAVDGREHRLATGGSVNLSESLVLSGDAHLRRVTVGDATLGDGAGGTWRLAKTVFTNGPSLIVSYRGSYEAFSRSSERVDISRIEDPAFAPTGLDGVLVPARFHRHGVDAEWAGRFGSAWPYRFFASVDYDVETRRPVYGAGAELTFRPRKSVEISGRAEYQSASTGGNADSAAGLFSLVARFYH